MIIHVLCGVHIGHNMHAIYAISVVDVSVFIASVHAHIYNYVM